jgi:hypothetical protein
MSIQQLLVPNDFNINANTIALPNLLITANATYTGGSSGNMPNVQITLTKFNNMIMGTLYNPNQPQTGGSVTAGYYTFPAGTIPIDYLPDITGSYYTAPITVINGPSSPTNGDGAFCPGELVINGDGSLYIFALSANTSNGIVNYGVFTAATNAANDYGFFRSTFSYFR